MEPPAKRMRLNSSTCSVSPAQGSLALETFIPPHMDRDEICSASPDDENLEYSSSIDETNDNDDESSLSKRFTPKPRDPGLPEPILNYLKKNAPPKLLLKLMQVSKYFKYKEFPYLVVRSIIFSDGMLKYSPEGYYGTKEHELDLENVSKPIWITELVCVSNDVDSTLASRLLSKIVVCDAQTLLFIDQDLNFDEFKKYVSSNIVTYLSYCGNGFKDEYGTFVSHKEIMKVLPKLKFFKWWYYNNGEERMTETCTKTLIELIDIHGLQTFELDGIGEEFEFDMFTTFMEAHPEIRFRLSFSYNISNEYATELQVYVDQLVESGEYLNRKILIDFAQENLESNLILLNHYYKK